MTGHRLVDGQVLNRVQVVLAQKRRDLVFVPVLGQGGDCVVRAQALIERSRPVVVGDGDAALELRHDDDLDRVLGQGDDVFLDNEFACLREILPRGVDNAVTWRQLAVGFFEGRADDGLLVGLVGHIRKRGESMFAGIDLFGDVVHLVTHGLVFRLGQAPYLPPAE